MDRMLYLAVLVSTGEVTIPTDAHSIEMYTSEVYFEDVNGKYISCRSFDNEQVAYDTHMIEFHGDPEFTVEEFNTYLASSSDAVVRFEQKRKEAVQALVEIVERVQQDIVDGMSIASEAGVPFMIQLGGSSFDLRKIKAVDWDSSSMYC